MRDILFELLQLVVIVLIAPLVTGFIKKTKALLQGRRGPRVLQPYYDLYKYMRKDAVVSKASSWIFTATPYVVFGATLAAAALVPVFMRDSLFSFTGDLVLLVYLFALARFFIAMAGVDTGSSFGAQGASREMFVSSLAEPALFVTLLAAALPAGTTHLSSIVAHAAERGWPTSPVFYMMVVAFAILVIAETGRIPVDNPDTHLELTMIHEGPILEYSGKSLALLQWSASIKQVLLFALLADLCFPWGLAASADGPAVLAGLAVFAVKMAAIGVIVSCVEMSTAKMRLFKVPRLLGAALVLSLFALTAEYLM